MDDQDANPDEPAEVQEPHAVRPTVLVLPAMPETEPEAWG